MSSGFELFFCDTKDLREHISEDKFMSGIISQIFL